MNDLIIKNIKGLVQYSNLPARKKSGRDMSILPVLFNSFLQIENGLISDFGSMEQYNINEGSIAVIDAKEKFVLPAWIDSHTHIVFAGSRESEFVMKIKGAIYEEIYKKGGGILNSVQKLRETPFEILLENSLLRLDEMIRLGTGAIEIKSGYGLSTESELKMLRVIKKIKELSPIPVKATFLGAHAIPAEFKKNRKGYIDLIVNEMLPQIAEEDLAQYIDVFCDEGFFTVEETDLLLKEAAKYGIKPKIHANEMGISGGVQVGVRNMAVSVDHLERVGDDEIFILNNSSTIPVVLPSTSFFLGIPYAPARKMIDNGLAVAIASDYNPGSSPSGNMNFSISLACINMKLLPEEAINAATINAACALELENEMGAIAKGMKGNLILTKQIPSISFLPYSFGNPAIDKVIINGRIYEGLK